MSCVGFKAAVHTVDLFVGVVVHDENGDAWSASAGILVHLAYAVTVQRRRLSWTWLGVHVEGDRLPEARARASSISRRDPKLRSAERPRSAAGNRASPSGRGRAPVFSATPTAAASTHVSATPGASSDTREEPTSAHPYAQSCSPRRRPCVDVPMRRSAITYNRCRNSISGIPLRGCPEVRTAQED